MDTTDRKKSYLWLLIIILIAFISGGTGYLMARYELDKQIENMNSQLNSLQTQIAQLDKNSNTLNNSTSSETDETADWKTYTNTTYGFSFKYPKDWTKEEGTTGVSIMSPATKKIKDASPEGVSVDLMISFYKNIKNEPLNVTNKLDATTLDEFVEKNDEITSKSQITFAGQKAYEVIWPGRESGYKILVVKDTKFYNLSFERTAKASELSDELKLVKSSFQFTD